MCAWLCIVYCMRCICCVWLFVELVRWQVDGRNKYLHYSLVRIFINRVRKHIRSLKLLDNCLYVQLSTDRSDWQTYTTYLFLFQMSIIKYLHETRWTLHTNTYICHEQIMVHLTDIYLVLSLHSFSNIEYLKKEDFLVEHGHCWLVVEINHRHDNDSSIGLMHLSLDSNR